MYTCGQGNGVVRGATVTVQQVRQLSRRKYKYPQAYTPVLDPKTHPKKDHRSWFRRHMIAWLGPTNIRGEYYKNKYYYPPQDHQPRYIVQDGHTDGTVQQPEENGKFFSRRNTRNVFQPFPENPHCKTALMISNELKDQMHKEVTVKGLHSQQVAHKYGIKIARVEAISKLEQIKAQWKEQVCFHFYSISIHFVRNVSIFFMMRLFYFRLVLKTNYMVRILLLRIIN